eukprot:SAG22_NODE_511_length_9594_cov_4.553449_3_plen_61_part_00
MAELWSRAVQAYGCALSGLHDHSKVLYQQVVSATKRDTATLFFPASLVLVNAGLVYLQQR